MASIKLEYGSLTTALSTELNSLADDANAISAAWDNETDGWIFADVEFSIGDTGYAIGTDPKIYLYLLESMDGTNYEDGNASIDPPETNLVGVFNLRPSVTSAQRHSLKRIHLVPRKYKWLVINRVGQALSSTDNQLKFLPYRYKTV